MVSCVRKPRCSCPTGNLLTTTNPLGNATQRTYHVVSRLMQFPDPRSFDTHSQYDNLNRVTQITDAMNGVLRENRRTPRRTVSWLTSTSWDDRPLRALDALDENRWLLSMKTGGHFQLQTGGHFDDNTKGSLP